MITTTEQTHRDPAGWPIPPARLVLTEAAEAIRFWPEARQNPRLAPSEAVDVLAAWAHLQRFPPAVITGSVTEDLARLVADDSSVLVTSLLRQSSVGGWLEAASALEQGWDAALQVEELGELEEASRDLFHALDQGALAAWAANRLLDPESPHRGKLSEIREEIARCENFFADHAEAFLPAAGLATAMLLAYRADLDEVDLELEETTDKYTLLAEIRDQDQHPPARARLREAEKARLVAQEREMPDPPYNACASTVSAEEFPLALAADLLGLRNRARDQFTFMPSTGGALFPSFETMAFTAAGEQQVIKLGARPHSIRTEASPDPAIAVTMRPVTVTLRDHPLRQLEVTFRTERRGHAYRKVAFAFVDPWNRRVRLWAEVVLDPVEGTDSEWEGVWRGTAAFAEPCQFYFMPLFEER